MQDISKSIDIAVVIVNYGTAALAMQAVQSVLDRDRDDLRVEIHLVDNGSPGEDRKILEEAMQDTKWQASVVFYPEETNHGFGRAHNLVYRALIEQGRLPKAAFMLNPDARLDNNALSILFEFLNGRPEVGIAGASVTKPEAGPVVAAFRFPSAKAEFGKYVGFGPLYRWSETVQVPLPPDHPEGPVDWVTGAAFMARFDLLEKIDFFDPAFFLYFEEVDLMRRAAETGAEIWYVPRARVLHHEGVATGVKSGSEARRRNPPYWYHSWAHYFRNAYGRFGALVCALITLLAAILHYPFALLQGRQATLPEWFAVDFFRYAVLDLVMNRRLQVEETVVNTTPEDGWGASDNNPKDIGFWSLVREDFETHERDFFAQGFWAIFWHRYGNWRMGFRSRLLRGLLGLVYRVMSKLCEWFGGIMLPYAVPVGRRVKLEHFGGMVLSARRIGHDVIIRQNTTFGISDLDHLEGRPVIGNSVEIGAGAVILGDIEIGEYAVIGANAVVVKSVPAHAIVGGVPARLIRMRTS